MTRNERYKEQLVKLEVKYYQLLRSGKYIQAQELHNKIREIERLIKVTEEYEEATKPRPIEELLSRDEINKMGIIPLMVECHLVSDFLVEIIDIISDICKKHGLKGLKFTEDIEKALKANEVFASFLTKVTPELCELITNNETFNASLHKKYLKYIEQRLIPKQKKKND